MTAVSTAHAKVAAAPKQGQSGDYEAAIDVTSLVLSRIDYCNVVLAGLPASTIAPLLRV